MTPLTSSSLSRVFTQLPADRRAALTEALTQTAESTRTGQLTSDAGAARLRSLITGAGAVQEVDAIVRDLLADVMTGAPISFAAFTPADGAPLATRAGVSLGWGETNTLISPTATGTYPVTLERGGKQITLNVKVAPELADALKKNGGQLDLQTAELVLNGARTSLSSIKLDEPWAQLLGPGLVATPTGDVTVTKDPWGRGFALEFRTIQPNERVFWRGADLVGRGEPPESAFTPSELPKVARQIAPDIKVLASSEEEARTVQKSFEGVAKNTMQFWPKVTKELRPIITELHDLHGKIKQEHYYTSNPDPAKIAGWVARAKELLPADKIGKLRDVPDVDRAIGVHLKALRLAANPLQIVVVPDEKHWLSMLDNFPNIERPTTFAESNMIAAAGIGAMAVGETTNVLFISAQDAKPDSLVLDHESMHVVYESFLYGHPLRAQLDAERDKGIDGEGPVASPYSLVEGEFPTTMAELFLGHGGPEGTRWLADHSRKTYDTLAEIIGKNPLQLPRATT